MTIAEEELFGALLGCIYYDKANTHKFTGKAE